MTLAPIDVETVRRFTAKAYNNVLLGGTNTASRDQFTFGGDVVIGF